MRGYAAHFCRPNGQQRSVFSNAAPRKRYHFGALTLASKFVLLVITFAPFYHGLSLEDLVLFFCYSAHFCRLKGLQRSVFSNAATPQKRSLRRTHPCKQVRASRDNFCTLLSRLVFGGFSFVFFCYAAHFCRPNGQQRSVCQCALLIYLTISADYYKLN